jgi:hypothetical protein
MELIVRPGGAVACVYGEAIDLSAMGELTIRRASHVEPDDLGRWFVDLSPVNGPMLGPFDHRSAALAAEAEWLSVRLHRMTSYTEQGEPNENRSVDHRDRTGLAADGGQLLGRGAGDRRGRHPAGAHEGE